MAPTGNGKTVLLAEDEQPVRTFVFQMLTKAGYSIITAVDGQDALQKSRHFEGIIDLLLSDVEMPNMTGIELATQLQMDRPEIRVLLMSGMPSGILLLNEGWQFLPKPFMSNLVKERIHHLLQGERPNDGTGENPTSSCGD
jgi:DNA-binding response OmpR family regulator